jgi:hypothetical protein
MTTAPAERIRFREGAGGLDGLVALDIWTDEDVAAAGIAVRDTSFVTVGGGIGSFVMADFLRIYGLPSSEIRVLTNLEYPWQTYEYLLRCSQIDRPDRLRSDSSSMPDNMWGFPSYAVVEAWRERTPAPLWNVLTEPILSDYWTPRSGSVFDGLRREADRIDYWSSVERGHAGLVRRRAGGGYFTILEPGDASDGAGPVAWRSRVVHLALGYAGLNFLPDLQEYRVRHDDHHRVVNAYEPHEHVYADLMRRPCTVIVRGGGIAASRVLERLIQGRDRGNTKTTICHLFRTYVDRAHGPNMFNRRRGSKGWAYQGFNYPKAVWGGELWARFRQLEGADRARMYEIIGGTTTARRRSWLRQQARGRAEGWYRAYAGGIDEIRPGAGGKLEATITTTGPDEPATRVFEVDYIIDCTGLEADIAEHRLIADLLDHSGAGRNVLDRLDVERTFEVRGTRSGAGRLYASGAATLGGYFPGSDTLLGLQLSSREIADDVAELGLVPRLGSLRSIAEWIRFARNRPPRDS